MALRSLIVDDSLGFLAVARGLLEQGGIEVVGTATSGAEAIRLARELRPDLALVDIDLGEESGFDVAARLAEQDGALAAGLILISTHAEEEFAELIETSPAVGFLDKSELSAEAVKAVLTRGRQT